MAKVWTLSEYEFPDINDLIGVYSSRENAERVMAQRQCQRDVIEEVELDAKLDWCQVKFYQTSVSIRSGEVSGLKVFSDWADPAERFGIAWCGGSSVCAISTENLEEAERLARELLAKEGNK